MCWEDQVCRVRSWTGEAGTPFPKRLSDAAGFEVIFLRVSHSCPLRHTVGFRRVRTRVCNIPFRIRNRGLEGALREWNTVALYGAGASLLCGSLREVNKRWVLVGPW